MAMDRWGAGTNLKYKLLVFRPANTVYKYVITVYMVLQ